MDQVSGEHLQDHWSSGYVPSTEGEGDILLLVQILTKLAQTHFLDGGKK